MVSADVAQSATNTKAIQFKPPVAGMGTDATLGTVSDSAAVVSAMTVYDLNVAASAPSAYLATGDTLYASMSHGGAGQNIVGLHCSAEVIEW